MESFNEVLAGLFCLALLFILLSSWKNVSNKPPPPEAGQALPLIGHLHLMASSKLPHKMLGAMADKLGPIFTIRMGMQRILVISNSELAKECFTTNDVAVSSRPRSVCLDQFSYNYAMFGFAPYGPFWRDLRKISSLELLTSKRIEFLEHFRISETHQFITEFYKSASATLLEGSVKLDMKEMFGKLTFNMVLQMVVGKRYVERYSGTADDDVNVYMRSLSEFFLLMGVFVVADAFPILRWLDIGGHEKEAKAAAKELDRIATQWLEEHKSKRASGEDSNHGVKQDFMAAMLSILEDTPVAGFDNDTVNKATCFIMISGGTDTTTSVLIWTLSLLLNNPKVLRKAQEELDLHVGKKRLVIGSDIDNLVYLKAVVKESMRIQPPAPLAVRREVREDCTIGGYHVPKGTTLMVNAWKIQNDPEIWPEPSEFRPERFLTSHKDVDVRGLQQELIPFGSDRRACPGMSFGLQVLHSVLAAFLQAFDVRSAAADGLVDMRESYGLNCVKATPLEVFITPRLPLSLYE